MSTKSKVFVGFICGIVFAIAVPLLILALGIIDWGATRPPGPGEKILANWALTSSLQRRAPTQGNPYAGQSSVVAEGMNHFRENCVMCHGAPGVKPAEIGLGLNPAAPKLEAAETQKMTDGQLFWIIKNGIRMTGMPAFTPTHKDQEIWQIVSFVRHLPQLTPSERSQLQPQEHGDHEHH